MIVFLWSAGTASGVTDSQRTARRHAATWMRSQQADAALIEQAHFIPGIELLDTGYERASRRSVPGRTTPPRRPDLLAAVRARSGTGGTATTTDREANR